MSDLFLYSYEAGFVQNQQKSNFKAQKHNLTSLSAKKMMFHHCITISSMIMLLSYIQQSLTLKTQNMANYHDLRLEFDEVVDFTHNYNKRDDFDFPIASIYTYELTHSNACKLLGG